MKIAIIISYSILLKTTRKLVVRWRENTVNEEGDGQLNLLNSLNECKVRAIPKLVESTHSLGLKARR